MLFVVHALDKKDFLPTRAKHYRDHRIHLDKSGDHGVDVVTAGTLACRRRRDAGRQHFCHRRGRPRRGRCFHPQRSLSPQRRVGARRHPPLQQETRHRDCEQAVISFRPRDSGGGGPLELAKRANRGGGGAGRKDCFAAQGLPHCRAPPPPRFARSPSPASLRYAVAERRGFSRFPCAPAARSPRRKSTAAR